MNIPELSFGLFPCTALSMKVIGQHLLKQTRVVTDHQNEWQFHKLIAVNAKPCFCTKSELSHTFRILLNISVLHCLCS